jgi:hypothetical protein
MPMIDGSTPTVTNDLKIAMGSMPSFSARFCFITMAAAAPSERGEELPAVTLPFAANTGRSFDSDSAVVPGRGNSSTLNSNIWRSPLLSNFTPCTGTISSTKAPFSMAASARSWLRAANSSCASRLMLNRLATFSAVMPIGV